MAAEEDVALTDGTADGAATKDGVSLYGTTLRGKQVQFTRGIPTLDDEALGFGKKHANEGPPFSFVFLPLAGLGVAHAVYSWGSTALYDKQIALLQGAECGWMYIIVVLFVILGLHLNSYPIFFKNKIFHSPGDDAAILKIPELSNLRGPNQLVYKQLSAASNGVPTDEEKERGYIVVENEGLIGEYNRANRSMHHYVENNVATGARLMCSAFVFPFPTFVTFVLFAVGRILHQVGYTDAKGYGSWTRIGGFMLSFMFGELPQVGFVLYAGLKTLEQF